MPKTELTLRSTVLNAAGSLGFAPDPRGAVNLDGLGAFVTNPISWRPRRPAHNPTVLPYPGGFLLHAGYPNPGFKAALRRYAPRWRRASLPVIVHLLVSGRDPDAIGHAERMIERLEGMENIAAVELGAPPEADDAFVASLVRSASGELPLILRLPLERAPALSYSLVDPGIGELLSAVSLAPPRGSLPDEDGDLIEGRLYGPAIFPLALAAVKAMAQSGLPVIGSGGVYHPQDIEMLLVAGAMAVQVDTWLWHGGFENSLYENSL